MARPIKQGLDYFPLDVGIFTDNKLKYISARFGEKGKLIVVELLCEIYRDGYYTDWNEDRAIIFAPYVGRNATHSRVNDVVGELVKHEFFDRDIFNSFAILTSKAIQRRFLKAVAERKLIEINSDYWLIEVPNNTSKSSFSVNPKINVIKPSDNIQSKAKESKAKHAYSTSVDVCVSKPQDSVKKEKELQAMFDDIWEMYPKKQGKQDAFKHFIRDIKAGANIENIRQGTQAYDFYCKQNNAEQRYIKTGSTFFSGKFWNDEWAVFNCKQQKSTTEMSCEELFGEESVIEIIDVG